MDPYNLGADDAFEQPDDRPQRRSSGVPVGQTVNVEAEVAHTAQVSVSQARSVLDTLKRMASVSELLRILGAAVMVGALSMFMMQGWLEGNDIQRYFKLLAETLLLTAGGFFLSAWLKEHKGARLFFGLGLASIAANFTILGALVYSVFQFDGLLGNYPKYAAWVSQSPGQVLVVTALALAVLIPVTRLAFSVLARPAAGWLTSTYLLGGALLLIPVRGSVWSCLLAAGFVAFAISRIARHRQGERTPDTTESRFSLLMLFLPPIILCVRSLYFYDVEALALGCMSVAAFLLLRHLSLGSRHLAVQRTLDTVSVPLALAAAGSLVSGLSFVHYTMQFPLLALLLFVMLGELTVRRMNTTRSTVFGALGALLVSSILMCNELFADSFAVALTGLAGASLLIASGYWLKRAVISFFGVLTMLFIAIDCALEFSHWFHVNNWVLLSILGAGAIVLASLLDRHGASLKLKLDALRANYARA